MAPVHSKFAVDQSARTYESEIRCGPVGKAFAIANERQWTYAEQKELWKRWKCRGTWRRFLQLYKKQHITPKRRLEKSIQGALRKARQAKSADETRKANAKKNRLLYKFGQLNRRAHEICKDTLYYADDADYLETTLRQSTLDHIDLDDIEFPCEHLAVENIDHIDPLDDSDVHLPSYCHGYGGNCLTHTEHYDHTHSPTDYDENGVLIARVMPREPDRFFGGGRLQAMASGGVGDDVEMEEHGIPADAELIPGQLRRRTTLRISNGLHLFPRHANPALVRTLDGDIWASTNGTNFRAFKQLEQDLGRIQPPARSSDPDACAPFNVQDTLPSTKCHKKLFSKAVQLVANKKHVGWIVQITNNKRDLASEEEVTCSIRVHNKGGHKGQTQLRVSDRNKVAGEMFTFATTGDVTGLQQTLLTFCEHCPMQPGQYDLGTRNLFGRAALLASPPGARLVELPTLFWVKLNHRTRGAKATWVLRCTVTVYRQLPGGGVSPEEVQVELSSSKQGARRVGRVPRIPSTFAEQLVIGSPPRSELPRAQQDSLCAALRWITSQIHGKVASEAAARTHYVICKEILGYQIGVKQTAIDGLKIFAWKSTDSGYDLFLSSSAQERLGERSLNVIGLPDSHDAVHRTLERGLRYWQQSGDIVRTWEQVSLWADFEWEMLSQGATTPQQDPCQPSQRDHKTHLCEVCKALTICEWLELQNGKRACPTCRDPTTACVNCADNPSKCTRTIPTCSACSENELICEYDRETCVSCRSRELQCDGQRPICGPCQKDNLKDCKYGPAGRTSVACLECKDSGEACDRILPQCGACARSNKNCVYQSKATVDCTACKAAGAICDRAAPQCGACKASKKDCKYKAVKGSDCKNCAAARVTCDRSLPTCEMCASRKLTNCTYFFATTKAKRDCIACTITGSACDRSRPACSTCQAAKNKCVYRDTEFKWAKLTDGPSHPLNAVQQQFRKLVNMELSRLVELKPDSQELADRLAEIKAQGPWTEFVQLNGMNRFYARSDRQKKKWSGIPDNFLGGMLDPAETNNFRTEVCAFYPAAAVEINGTLRTVIHHFRNCRLSKKFANALQHIFGNLVIRYYADVLNNEDVLEDRLTRFDHMYLICQQLGWQRDERLLQSSNHVARVQRQLDTGLADPTAVAQIEKPWILRIGVEAHRDAVIFGDIDPEDFQGYDQAVEQIRALEEKYHVKFGEVPYAFSARNKPKQWRIRSAQQYYGACLATMNRWCDQYHSNARSASQLLLLHCIQYCIAEELSGTGPVWMRRFLEPYSRHPLGASAGHANHGMEMQTGIDPESFSFDLEQCSINWETWTWNAMRGGRDEEYYRTLDALRTAGRAKLTPLMRDPLPPLTPVPATRWGGAKDGGDTDPGAAPGADTSDTASAVPKGQQAGSRTTAGLVPTSISKPTGSKVSALPRVPPPDPSSGVPRRNFSNDQSMCYVSSAVQAMANVSLLKRLILGSHPFPYSTNTGRNARIIRNDPRLEHHKQVLSSLRTAMDRLDRSEKRVDAHPILAVRDAMRGCYPSKWAPNQQNESAEFLFDLWDVINNSGDQSAPIEDHKKLQNIIDREHEEAYQALRPIGPAAGDVDRAWLGHLQKGNDSPLTQMMTTFVVRETRCALPTCPSPYTRSFHPLMSLSLQIPDDGDQNKVYDLMALMNPPEVMLNSSLDDGPIPCRWSDHPPKIGARRKVVHLPAVLAMRIDRQALDALNQYSDQAAIEGAARLLDNPIDFPDILDMTRFCNQKLYSEVDSGQDLEDSIGPRKKYRLQALIQSRPGHYVAYSLVEDGSAGSRWAVLDDTCSAPTWEDPRKTQMNQGCGVSMLFYVKISEDGTANEDLALLQTFLKGAGTAAAEAIEIPDSDDLIEGSDYMLDDIQLEKQGAQGVTDTTAQETKVPGREVDPFNVTEEEWESFTPSQTAERLATQLKSIAQPHLGFTSEEAQRLNDIADRFKKLVDDQASSATANELEELQTELRRLEALTDMAKAKSDLDYNRAEQKKSTMEADLARLQNELVHARADLAEVQNEMTDQTPRGPLTVDQLIAFLPNLSLDDLVQVNQAVANQIPRTLATPAPAPATRPTQAAGSLRPPALPRQPSSSPPPSQIPVAAQKRPLSSMNENYTSSSTKTAKTTAKAAEKSGKDAVPRFVPRKPAGTGTSSTLRAPAQTSILSYRSHTFPRSGVSGGKRVKEIVGSFENFGPPGKKGGDGKGDGGQ